MVNPLNPREDLTEETALDLYRALSMDDADPEEYRRRDAKRYMLLHAADQSLRDRMEEIGDECARELAAVRLSEWNAMQAA